MAQGERLHDQEINRVAAMTEAGQFKPEHSDSQMDLFEHRSVRDEDERFALLSRAADEEAGTRRRS